MSRFFESEMVRDTVMDLEKMQQQLAKDMYLIGTYSKEQKQDHLKLLKAFLEKQKLFFFRVSLSDDPDAVMIKEKVLEAPRCLVTANLMVWTSSLRNWMRPSRI